MSEEDTTKTGGLIKGGLIVVGGVVVLGLALNLFKTVLFLGVAAGGGYLCYRLLTGKKRAKGLGSADAPRALPDRSEDDFERRMRELDALERKLDAEIGQD